MNKKISVAAGAFLLAQAISPAAHAAKSSGLDGLFNLINPLLVVSNSVLLGIPTGLGRTLGAVSLSTVHLDSLPVLGAVAGTITPTEGIFDLQAILSAQQSVLQGGAIEGLPRLPGLSQ